MQEKTGGHSAAANAGVSIASALFMAFCITIPALLIFAAILTFTDFPDKFTTIAVVLATITGLFIAGFRAGANNEKNGMIKGGLTGVSYMLILYLISSILFKDFVLNLQAIIMLVTGILAGAIGGLLGMNRKAKPMSRFNSFNRGNDLHKRYRK